MMPAQNRSPSLTENSELYLRNMKDILNLESNMDEGEDISSIIHALHSSKELTVVSDCDKKASIDACEVFTDYEENVKLIQYSELESSCCDAGSGISINISSQTPLQSLSESTLNHSPIFQSNSFSKKSVIELNSCSIEELQVLLENLNHTAKEVSSELVQLLLENDALQQESDARNVAIEQLLKITVKNSESELKPIQMSIILPSDESDAI